MTLELKGLKSAVTERELILAVKTVEKILDVRIFPEEIDSNKIRKPVLNFSKENPRQSKVFKEILRIVNSGNKLDQQKISELRLRFFVPEGWQKITEKFPEISSNMDTRYTKMANILKVLRDTRQFLENKNWVEYKIKSVKKGSIYYSQEMLDEALRIYYKK